MPRTKTKRDARSRRKQRIRKKLTGTPEKPRLSVFRSLNHIYVQAIDDSTGKTLFAASSTEVKGKSKGTGNRDAAKLVGELIANKCKDKGIEYVVFDRGVYLYNVRVNAFEDAARAAGLKF